RRGRGVVVGAGEGEADVLEGIIDGLVLVGGGEALEAAVDADVDRGGAALDENARGPQRGLEVEGGGRAAEAGAQAGVAEEADVGRVVQVDAEVKFDVEVAGDGQACRAA